MFMDGDAQDNFGAVLVDYKVVQLLPQRFGRDVT
jgi:hypothetical protein